jgi:cyclophilin family peptidyl-prolyl cis-trans isomerase
MTRHISRFFVGLSTLLLLGLAEAQAQAPRVQLETTQGNITLELYPDEAPQTVKNFLDYVDAGYYNGTVFHRVIEGFMIQGGGYTADLSRKGDTRPPIRNEADNGLKNKRGTVAMARTSDPHSATAQFFINHVDNEFLDHTGKNVRGWGYCVFGEVVDGMDVVDKIAETPTGVRNRMPNVPEVPVVIVSAKRVESESTPAGQPEPEQ